MSGHEVGIFCLVLGQHPYLNTTRVIFNTSNAEKPLSFRPKKSSLVPLNSGFVHQNRIIHELLIRFFYQNNAIGNC